jgi:hypothetical protein
VAVEYHKVDFDNDGGYGLYSWYNGLNYKYKATAEETFDIFFQ